MTETRTPMPETGIKFITSERMVINILISTAIGLAIIAVAVGIAGDNPIIVGILAIAAVIDIVGIVLVSRGISLPGRILVPAILSVASGYIAYSRGGLYHIAMLGFPFIIALSGLLLGTRGVFIFAAITSMASIFIGYADINGLSPFSESSRTGYDDIAVVVTLLFLIAVVLRVIINLLTKSVQEAEEYGKTQEASNIELKNLQNDLEKRVEERTKELEGRTDQLQLVSEVARSVITIQDTDELLPAITRLVSERFGFYHVGIFLVDDDREYAALQAANSEGGQRMLERQHKLRLDTNSIVGFVSSRGEPRIALDVGVDSVFFDNPDLPDTRSEMALPLRVGGRVIGVLDVQSIEPNAFTEADVTTLSTLTDQVAIAIENAHLFGEARKSLKESKDTFSRYVKREWSSFTSYAKSTGYLFDGNRTIPLEAKDKRKKIRSLPQTGRLVLEQDTRELTIPIRLRGQVIGYLDVKPKNDKRKWTQDDMILLEAAAERAALALENARLVESAQQRASRELTIGEISTRIGAVSDLDAIMQAAVEELGRKISGAAEVTLELGAEQDKS